MRPQSNGLNFCFLQLLTYSLRVCGTLCAAYKRLFPLKPNMKFQVAIKHEIKEKEQLTESIGNDEARLIVLNKK